MLEVYKIINVADVPQDLLLLADPDIAQVHRYKHKTTFLAAYVENSIRGIVGVRKRKKKQAEIVSLAVYENWQRKKLGQNLIEKAIEFAKDQDYTKLIIKTGNSSLFQLGLYQKCGFRVESIKKDHFINSYKQPIYENGVQCVDQIVLSYRIYTQSEVKKATAKYWKQFLKKHPEHKDAEYEVWSFGHGNYEANTLLALVRQGVKTGTSSAGDLYDENEKKPENGEISIITFGNGLPACIVQTKDVKVKSFDKINSEEAQSEGEGDLSLEYWRKVHKDFFMLEYQSKGLEFHTKIPVIYENFHVIYDK